MDTLGASAGRPQVPLQSGLSGSGRGAFLAGKYALGSVPDRHLYG